MLFRSAAWPLLALALVAAAPARAEPAPSPKPVTLSVMTYNVEGLPWPVRSGRGKALKAIGHQ